MLFVFLNKFFMFFLKLIIIIFSIKQSILILLNDFILVLNFFTKLFFFLLSQFNILLIFTLLIQEILSNEYNSTNFLFFAHLSIIINNLIKSIYFMIFLFCPLKLLIHIFMTNPAHLLTFVCKNYYHNYISTWINLKKPCKIP